jgi:hypothetical protein
VVACTNHCIVPVDALEHNFLNTPVPTESSSRCAITKSTSKCEVTPKIVMEYDLNG